MAMPVQVSRCMLGMGALLYFFERWVSFFSKIANTPPGVLPLLPLLIVDRPIRMPLRYTCIVCCGMLTSTTTGPLGESCGFHQYSPGLACRLVYQSAYLLYGMTVAPSPEKR